MAMPSDHEVAMWRQGEDLDWETGVQSWKFTGFATGDAVKESNVCEQTNRERDCKKVSVNWNVRSKTDSTMSSTHLIALVP